MKRRWRVYVLSFEMHSEQKLSIGSSQSVPFGNTIKGNLCRHTITRNDDMKCTTRKTEVIFPSSVANRHFESDMDLQCLQMLICVNEPMCPRPYPVYIKMRAKANKQNKTTVSLCVCLCVCALYTVFVCAQKNRAAISGFLLFSVTKMENMGQLIVKKITINKVYGTLRD